MVTVVVDDRHPVGIAVTLAKNVAYALRSDVSTLRGSRLWYRAMVAYLHFLQPIARLRGQIRGMLSPPEERLLDGVRLYDQALDRMRLGVELQHPQANADEVERLLVSRVQKMWRLSDHGFYRAA